MKAKISPKCGSQGPTGSPRTGGFTASQSSAAAVAGHLITRILVGIDFSSVSGAALDYALRLATELHAKVFLLHVVETAPGFGHEFSLLEPGEDHACEHALDEEQRRLCDFFRNRPGNRVAVELLVRIGHAGSEIADTAKAVGADLIVLGCKAKARRGSSSFCSTGERVLQNAACPVLAVH